MPYSIGNSQLQVVKGDTNQALQAIGQAYGAVNDSYDKLARLPGMAKAMVQDDADARYTAALNKYSNDPNGLAQALANGEIDTSNVRAETLGKTQDTLSNIQKTDSLMYLTDRTKGFNDYFDKFSAQYQDMANDAKNGKDITAKLAELAKYAPAEAQDMLSQWDSNKQKNIEKQLGISGGTLSLALRKYLDEKRSIDDAVNLLKWQYTKGLNASPTHANTLVQGGFNGNATWSDGTPFDFSEAIRGAMGNAATAAVAKNIFDLTKGGNSPGPLTLAYQPNAKDTTTTTSAPTTWGDIFFSGRDSVGQYNQR